jgi:hypothetical protein
MEGFVPRLPRGFVNGFELNGLSVPSGVRRARHIRRTKGKPRQPILDLPFSISDKTFHLFSFLSKKKD